MPLISLPNDILSLICDSIRPADDLEHMARDGAREENEDLRNLSLTCSHLRSHTIRLIFKFVVCWEGEEPRLLTFLAARPHIACHIHELIVHDPETRPPVNATEADEEEAMNAARQVISSALETTKWTSFDGRTMSNEDFDQNSSGMISFMLSMLPSLKSLAVNPRRKNLLAWKELLLPTIKVLSRMDLATLAHQNNSPGIETCFPSIRELSLWSHFWPESLNGLAIRAPFLTSLSLVSRGVQCDALGELLSSVPNLNTFTYKALSNHAFLVPDPRDLVKAISAGKSIRVLELYLAKYEVRPMYHSTINISFLEMNFKGMESLKHLSLFFNNVLYGVSRIPMAVYELSQDFYSFIIFPRHIETLKIGLISKDAYGYYKPSFLRMLEMSPWECPNLKVIHEYEWECQVDHLEYHVASFGQAEV